MARAEWSKAETYEFEVSPLDAWVREYSWWVNRKGYIYRRSTLRVDGVKKSVNVYLHREILGLGFGNPLEGDHINNLPSINTRGNLQPLTKEENLRRRYANIEEAPTKN